MSYLTTKNKLVGTFKVKNHAVNRFRERHGNEYIGNKKIKNMSDKKLRRTIRKCLREKRDFISENDDGTVYVKTKYFGCIVDPKFSNDVITVL